MIFGLGSIYIVYHFLGSIMSDKKAPISATQNSATPAEKSIWDKLKIISIVLSAIAAFLYAIVKVVDMFNGK